MPLDAAVHRVKPGDAIELSELPTSGKEFSDNKEDVIADFEKLRENLIDLQYRLYAEGKRKLLVIFQAMDCGGKDGAIRHVFQGVNSQGVRVTSFKAPTAEELAYDFLWRIHREVPKTGMIGVFNRSHYEDIVAVRVMRLAAESIWKPRYEYINDFERMLTGSGTVIVKIFLHISKDEQRKRLQSRIDDPAKRWKFATDDLEKRLDWDEYMNAYSDAISHCNDKSAPWYVIPADQRWYRNWAVTKILVDHLNEMELKYPQPAIDWENLKIQ